MAAVKKGQGPDMLKFFIAAMSLLTALVAGFAGLYWSQVKALERQIEKARADFDDIGKMARDPDLRERVKRGRESAKKSRPINELDQFLDEEAKPFQFVPSLRPSPLTTRTQYLEKSTLIVIDGIDLRRLTAYLYNLQIKWPGLKIKVLRLSNFKEETGWKATVEVSLIKLKT